MKFCKYICFLFLCSLYVIIFLAIGYLAEMPLIILKVFAMALCAIVVFAYFWGGQIVLAVVKAQKLSQELFKHKVDNISCLLGLSQVNVYRSKELPSGVYILKGIGDSSYILFGGDAFEDLSLSPKELNALFCLSILKIKKLNLRFVQGCNFFFFIVYLPVFLLRKVGMLKYVTLMLEFFLLPLKHFKEFVFGDDGDYWEDGIKKLEIDGLEDVVGITLFKLKRVPRGHFREAHQILLSGLSVVK